MSDPSLKIAIKRAYDAPERGDGVRILVDRLWPRGLRKDAAHIDQWCKEVAPTTELRRFYGHRPDRFAAFRTRYRAELRRGDAAAAVAQLVGLQQRRAQLLHRQPVRSQRNRIRLDADRRFLAPADAHQAHAIEL